MPSPREHQSQVGVPRRLSLSTVAILTGALVLCLGVLLMLEVPLGLYHGIQFVCWVAIGLLVVFIIFGIMWGLGWQRYD